MHKKTIIGIFSVLVVVGGFVVYTMVRSASYANEPINASQTSSLDDGVLQAPNLPSKTSDENGVTVIVTPLLVSPDAATWEFDVVLSTHVQELGGYDLVKLATLVDENGNALKPISWAPDATEGHHIGGVLTFARIDPSSGTIAVKISDIGGEKERVFEWGL